MIKQLKYSRFPRKVAAFLMLILFSVSVQAQSLLWKIDGAKLNTASYLYGTIHIKDKRVFQFDQKVYEVLDSCKVFAMEVDLDPSNLAGFAQHLMLPEGKTLHDIFSPEDYSLIKNILEKETGMNISMFDRMKPFVLLSLGLNSQIAGDMEVAVDEFLYRRAQQEGIKVKGLETIEEQMEMLDEIPNDYITDYFRNFQKGAEDLEEIIRLYCKADLDRLLCLMQEDKTMASLEKKIITKRNKRMVARIMPLIKEQPVFIAVGAGHLPGKKGILKLLDKKGYTVTPVMLKSPVCKP
jgi:uncharacterized protein YbaP (TraB family)